MKTKLEDIIDGLKQNKTGKFKDSLGNIFYLYNGVAHIKNGPSDIWIDGYKQYCYYGHLAKDKNQFYDDIWRKKIEIKVFL